MNFRLEFKNIKNKKIIFSLPQSNHYQKIKNFKISPKTYQILKEKDWRNEVLIFRLNDINHPLPPSTSKFSPTAIKKYPFKFFFKRLQNKKT
ncbi:MAG: hypothetical protein KatS3mg091_160 [Patescibacteria group bacterium]|nr:MAG: hypothetical protein KatS3mg091_160 [Patescibacteria group bacterium]